MAVFSRNLAATTLLVVALGATAVLGAGVTSTRCNADGSANGTAVTVEFSSGNKVCVAGRKITASYSLPAMTTECIKATSQCVGFTSYSTSDCTGTAGPEGFSACDKCQPIGSASSLKMSCSAGSKTASLKVYTSAVDCTGSETAKEISDACSTPVGASGMMVTTAGFTCNTIKISRHEGAACDSATAAGTTMYGIQDKCNQGMKVSCPADTKDSVDSASAASVLVAVAAAVLAVVA